MRLRELVVVAAVPVLLAVACGSGPGPELVTAPAPSSSPAATATPAATPVPTPTPMATPTPLPSPTPTPRRLCQSDPDAYATRIGELEAAVAAALEGYRATYGFALHDLDCDTVAIVNPDHAQYTASTGKLPFVIAALRAVQDGRLDMAAVEDDIVTVLHISSDDAANRIVAKVPVEDVLDVLTIAGVSDQTRFRDSWSNFNSTAVDLTKIWTALLRGELLDEERTELVLRLAAEADVDRAYETVWSHFDIPGLVFGQKVGHAVIFAPPYYLVGSGYLRPESGVSAGFAVTLVIVSDSLDPQRKDVFPLVLDFAQEAFAEVAPG